MKITIRQGVFETNSSSMHALAMQKEFNLNCEQCKDMYKKLIPDHISFNITDWEAEHYEDGNIFDSEKRKYRECTKEEVIINKIIFVYSNIIARMSANQYSYTKNGKLCYGYINLTQFFSWLTKLGITYDIPYQPDGFSVDDHAAQNDAFFYSPCNDELFEHIYDGTEETFCNFLFGDGSKLDSYNTDCIPYDKYDEFEKEFWDELGNHGKCVTYHYYAG